ncbi:MAG: ferrous iron transport protein A [Clostridiales bacterium]|nr:ferrous iron transport protein A [Clostridiales bacterium]
MTVDELKVGESAVITEVGGSGALRRHLLDMGLIPRTEIYIRRIAPMKDPIELTLRGYELTIRLEDAAKIKVRKADGNE